VNIETGSSKLRSLLSSSQLCREGGPYSLYKGGSDILTILSLGCIESYHPPKEKKEKI